MISVKKIYTALEFVSNSASSFNKRGTPSVAIISLSLAAMLPMLPTSKEARLPARARQDGVWLSELPTVCHWLEPVPVSVLPLWPLPIVISDTPAVDTDCTDPDL